MWFLPRVQFGRDRKAEALERRVSALQLALAECSEMAGRWTGFRREVTVGIAVLMLVLGFAVGVYREPIHEFVAGVTRAAGFSIPIRTGGDAYSAYRNGDYATVLRLTRPLADEGDVRAQSLLALIYYRGHGVPRDDIVAAKWFRRAADQGDGVAQFHLGLMHFEGKGVPKDYAEAAKWYRLAADRGNPEAQYNLGVIYASGEARETDSVSAYMWFSLAAAHFPVSDTRRNTAVTSRDLVAKPMTRYQIAEAQKRAREWKWSGG